MALIYSNREVKAQLERLTKAHDLTEWEEDFVADINLRVIEKGFESLSEKQKQTISKIYVEKGF